MEEPVAAALVAELEAGQGVTREPAQGELVEMAFAALVAQAAASEVLVAEAILDAVSSRVQVLYQPD